LKQFNEKIRCHTARRTSRRFMQNNEHVTRFYLHAVGLRIDDVTARAFVLHELSNLGLNSPPPLKWKMFLNPYSFGILLIYKQCASSCPTNYVVSTVELMTQVMCDKPIPMARSLRRWCATARLLGLRVRIPPGSMDVCLL